MQLEQNVTPCREQYMQLIFEKKVIESLVIIIRKTIYNKKTPCYTKKQAVVTRKELVITRNIAIIEKY